MEWTEDYSPDPLSEIRSAQAADEAERRRREAAAQIQRGIDMVIQRRTSVPRQPAPAVDDNLKAWLLSRKAKQEDQAAGLAQQKIDAVERRNEEDGPAPPEWGALPGMTRKEALRAGYAKAPKVESDAPEEMAPPEWHDKLRAMGVPNPEGVSRKFAERLMVADIGRQGQVQATIGAEERRTEREAPGAARDAAMKLRQEFQGQQVYKDMQTVATAYEKIQQAAPTGAGDLALVYGYMKLLDPGSTVREGEFANASSAGSVPERIWGLYNKIASGERLPPGVREQFKKEALGVLQAQKRRYDAETKKYTDLAGKLGIDPSLVVSDMNLLEDRKFVNGRVYEKRNGKWYDIGSEIK